MPKNKRKHNNRRIRQMLKKGIESSGFTLIEVLSVIIILGILLIIAIPSVTNYLDSSRSSSYVNTAKGFMTGARNMVNEGKLSFYDTDVSYFIPISCIKTEAANKSPYGDFDPAYVIVNFKENGTGFDYYWVSRDTQGIGVEKPIAYDDLDEDDIVDGIEFSDIRTDRTVGNRSYTYIYNDDCSSGEKKGACSSVPMEFGYTGAVQTLKIKCTGSYILETWGAQGGYRSNPSYSGKGGYSHGVIKLKSQDTLYIYVGGSGNTGGTAGGFNGGGARNRFNGGGGASDIRINQDSLYSRVIVAGGGGSDGRTTYGGGAAGGTQGSNSSSGCGTGGYGGTQTGNTSGTYITTTKTQDVDDYFNNIYSGFGFGGNGVYHANGYGGAGGGGWYGGTGTYPDGSADDDKGGGGGSGYVYTSSTASNYPSGCLLNNYYYLKNAETLSGTQVFDSPDGITETGHSGNGYVRITYIEE